MKVRRQRSRPFLDRAERLLASASARLALSALIILSVLPEAGRLALLPANAVSRLDPFFLVVFSLELVLRLALAVRNWRLRRMRRWDVLLLVLDFLAVLSFLPVEAMIESEYFRLLRLGRMLLLFGYWGQMARELLAILNAPERRYQVVMVLFLGLGLSFCGSVIVTQLAPGYDYDGDGSVEPEDGSFVNVLWWSFRQVQDPGNLVERVDQPLIVTVSLLLTLAGLLLFSFIVGIGTGVIDELLVRLREQPVGLQEHTVVLGLTSHSEILLRGLAQIYKKNLRPVFAAVLGREAETPAYLHRPMLRTFYYRSGDPVGVADLDRLDIRHAKRVVILGSDQRNPDGEVIAAVLATRERNPRVDLYPDVEHEKNFRAVRSAGGPRTHLVGSGSFLGYYLAQNVLYPGSHHFYRILLRTAGCEIYTYIWSPEERRRLLSAATTVDPMALHQLAYHEYGVTLIGLFAGDEGPEELEDEDLAIVLNPVRQSRRPAKEPPFDRDGRVRWPAVRGLIGISVRWSHVRRLALRLIESPVVPELEGRETPPFPGLALRPARGPLDRVLILGGSLRVPRVVMELATASPRIAIAVLLQGTKRLRALERSVRSMLTELLGPPSSAERHDGRVTLRWAASGGERRVDFLEADWTDRDELREAGVPDLETADAVLLLPGGSVAQELDGRVALDCLHMANLARSGSVELRPGLHVLGMVRDPVKGDLLDSRLTRDGGEPRFSIVSSERARHRFIMQNVFVRGLNSIFLELLSFAGQHAARLLPTDASGGRPAGSFDPAALADHLLGRGLVLLGLELGTPDQAPDVELDAEELRSRSSVPWDSVRALYVLGEREDVESCRPCKRSASLICPRKRDRTSAELRNCAR